MLTHGGASSHTGPVPVVAEPAPRTSLVSTGRPRNDPNIAPIAGAHRTQITDWSNVARAATSEVLTNILKDTQLSPRPSRTPRAPSSTPQGPGGPADTALLAHVRRAAAQPPRRELPAESGKTGNGEQCRGGRFSRGHRPARVRSRPAGPPGNCGPGTPASSYLWQRQRRETTTRRPG